MKLNLKSISADGELAKAGIKVPEFDVSAVQERARKEPRWIHLGPGNIFRIFLARIADDALAAGDYWPITGVVPMDPKEQDLQLTPFDNLTLGVILNPDGSRDERVIAGMAESLSWQREADWERLTKLMADPSVTLMTFTVTEKGYSIQDSHGNVTDAVKDAFNGDPYARNANTMVSVAALLAHRYREGAAPITLLSTDNFSHNGDKLRDSILTVATGWVEAGKMEQGFADWVSDSSKVAFPISVIDKITPRPSEEVSEALATAGFEDMGIDHVGRTPVAGFVNSEPTEYLIVEDNFAADRPKLENYGVIITDRETCDAFESMKVSSCLNPLHTALAISGVLLHFPTIDSEMRDADLSALVHRLGWKETLPVATNPGIVKPEDFLGEVLEQRFPNRYLPDSPARIAMDTSQKLPIRYGVPVKEHIKRGTDLDSLVAIPLVFALWARYLMQVDDEGKEFEPSSDPLYDELHEYVKDIKLGEDTDVHAHLQPIFSNAAIFGVDLYTTPLGAKAEALFSRLIAGPGAIRTTIHEEIN
ncbi:mannitol dehydrogenase family protein [Neoactinobaculum massilliense]|mgnify:CR=1 FL=1|uniref:mannitol dehydrogenase family protein n=1 Tax=Neoactinobaculum massilliense TaxID=2364794 RepID=UPI000F53F8C3|nr:mannitol dehydrogenase family protein [Neoactinobaculum massilliense]